jgi:FkbH-like protein
LRLGFGVVTDLYWLPEIVDWRARMRAVSGLPPAEAWTALGALARARINFLRTHQLDVMLRRLCPGPPPGLATRPVRLALLGSSTLAHLAAAIRVGAARRGLFVSVHQAAYGQYVQELTDPGSALHAFRPDVVLVALDGFHLAGLPDPLGRLTETWALARAAFGCRVIQQTPLPVYPRLIGSNEHRLADSPAAALERLNHQLRDRAAAEGVDLLALDARAAQDGLAHWHDPSLWHRAKQEITPAAAPLYGDLVGRLLAAAQGRSAKCLVLDLDNTLWGGVVGDDGPEGLVLGQGSALGEAFVAFQHHARALSRRGVILAVCSKNDAANAAAPFARHPEMVLRREDIACFIANWQDKPANLRAIAAELNIGFDSLVFADDNPFERSLVREALPMVEVPELPDDPALYARTLADAGYFEALAITEDDRARTGQYQGNRARAASQEAATDLVSYLRGLEMELVWRPFDRIGLPRIVQLINKTNQFNLTTRRTTEAEVQAVIDDPAAFGLQFRLLDRFGDNGIIAIVIGRRDSGGDVRIDTWLMSCRVLGRQVEAAMLGVVAAESVRLGAGRLIGEYVPSGRNAMVKDHYANLGFTVIATDETGASRAVLALADHVPASTFIAVKAG